MSVGHTVRVTALIVCCAAVIVPTFLLGARTLSIGPVHLPAGSHMPAMGVIAAGLAVSVALLLTGAQPHRRGERQHSPAGRWLVLGVLVLALALDASKVATLGFVMPGMRAEYGITASHASLLAVAGLAGAATGALTCGLLAGRVSRRSVVYFSALSFVGTATCGAMPTFNGNLVMCAAMGFAVGGLVPVVVAQAAELAPAAHRGPTLVVFTVAGSTLGYLIASGTALLLNPLFGWRALWLAGAPTGVVLLALTPLLPVTGTPAAPGRGSSGQPPTRWTTVYGLSWYAMVAGVLTLGLLTWLPSMARASGFEAHTVNAMLTTSAMWMLPAAPLLAVVYARLRAKRFAITISLVATLTTAATAVVLATSMPAWTFVLASASVLLACHAMTALLLPVTADLHHPAVRARAGGLVSSGNRVGGLAGPILFSYASHSVPLAALATALGGALALGAGAGLHALCPRGEVVAADGSGQGQ